MTAEFGSVPYPYEQRPDMLLRRMIGPTAVFRDGQREAIDALTEELARLLVVQSTGWGKSAVYFIATKMRREQGYGPTLLISPLLSLMRNQLAMAERLGIQAATINSTNDGEWNDIESRLQRDEIDIVLISPERLANARFQRVTVSAFSRGIGMFVVDEAHCISDWGHDFRPDYRRIVGVLQRLPATMPVLATTATANDRVVDDIADQLGPDLRVVRGPLARKTLRLQTICLDQQSERLAWLAANVPKLPGSGIIYCLTVADTERVAGWLRSNGIDARAYCGGMQNDERVRLEDMLLENKVKVLVATVALGMGFDKPDLGFVVHYQRPGSVVAYYQQIGRAGRGGQDAYAVLLNGTEDDKIQEYFIRTAFPTPDESARVLTAIEDVEDGLDLSTLLNRVNIARGRAENVLKHFEVDGIVVRDGRTYFRTATPWNADTGRAERVTALKRKDLETMRTFVRGQGCLMEFVASELDDPAAAPCGRCAVCSGEVLPVGVDETLVRSAVTYLKRDVRPIASRKQFPAGFREHPSARPIPIELRVEEGFALSVYGDAGWGRLVKLGKQQHGRFDDELVDAMAELIMGRRRPSRFPTWVTAVPSARRPLLVPDFAERLATRLGMPFRDALAKVSDGAQQKTMENSLHQATNVDRSISVIGTQVLPGAVLLIDDFVDSGWTMTICGTRLREAGSGPVYPAVLGCMTGAGSA